MEDYFFFVDLGVFTRLGLALAGVDLSDFLVGDRVIRWAAVGAVNDESRPYCRLGGLQEVFE